MPMSGDHPIRTAAVSGAELARLLAEPGFVVALSAAWVGSGSLADAVFWRQNPSTMAASGRQDPAAQLGELRARVYGRPVPGELIVETTDARGAPVKLAECEVQLLRLERRLGLDDRELDDAIVAASRAIARPEAAPLAVSSPTAVRTPGVFARVLSQHPTLVFSSSAILLVLLVVPVTAAVLEPFLRPSVGLLSVFDRPQGIIDLAPRVFTGGQPGATQRVRDTTRFLGTYYGVEVFTYRNSVEDVCLLSAAPGDHDVTVCASVNAFARSGLSIAPVNYHLNYTLEGASAGVTAASRLTFRWGPHSGLSVRVIG